MKIRAYLEGGDFDGSFTTFLFPDVPKELRVASVEADTPQDGRVMAAKYILFDSSVAESAYTWNTRYRWAGEADTAVSLIHVWLE